MAKVTKKSLKDAERAEAITALREMLPPGSTVYCVLRNVSRSGMSRHIDFYKMTEDGPRWLSGYMATALDMRRAPRDNGLVVSGCGMDMGFHVVYNLSSALYRGGFGCIGDKPVRCPSNDHSNGDRDYTPHMHVVSGPACLNEPGFSAFPCTCHDPAAWEDPTSYPDGCSACGCYRRPHWHNDGGYALTSRWL